MPSHLMDQHGVSPVPYLTGELPFSGEKRVGFWKSDTLMDHYGKKPNAVTGAPCSLPVASTPLVQLDSQPTKCLELPEQKVNFTLQRYAVGAERALSCSVNLWGPMDLSSGTKYNSNVQLNNGVSSLHENGLFSSSLSELFSKKLRLSSNNALYGHSVDTVASNNEEEETFESLEEIEAQTIGNLLPNDDDLLLGAVNGIQCITQQAGEDDIEDLDLFSSVGGMDLGDHTSSTGLKSSDFPENSNRQLCGTNVSPIGLYPYGEHPSRTLFVRNINSNVEDSELRTLFEDYPAEDDVNRGILVVYNLDPSVSNDDLHQIFGAYGKIKGIHEPLHSSKKLIEFYDVRAADEALDALNWSDNSGKKIKLGLSRPGGSRQSSMQPLPSKLELDEPGGLSLPQEFPHGPINCTSVESESSLGVNAGIQPPISSLIDSSLRPGISSSVPSGLPSFFRAESTCKQSGLSESGNSVSEVKYDLRGLATLHPHSLPEYSDGLATVSSYNYDGFGSPGNACGPLAGHSCMWTNSKHPQPPTYMWPNSPSFTSGLYTHSQHQLHGTTRSPSDMLSSVLSMNGHRARSDPAVNPPTWDGQYSFSGGLPEASGFHQDPLRNMRLSGNRLHHMNFFSHNSFPHVNGNCMDLQISCRNVALHSPHQKRMMYPSRGHINVVGSYEPPSERARGRRSENSSTQADKLHYELNIDRIRRGEDNKTTLMIKNIPNKYTSKMLMAAIDERHRGTYDFIYLPIDFKNKCNVGYAFINMVDPSHIIPFYETFNGKKWEKFNSEKVASLAYARIQGKAALIAHFQNSSLMNEDKRCRPILFHSDGPNAGDQVPFPMGVNIRSKASRSRSSSNEDNHQESPAHFANKEEVCNGEIYSPSGKESN